MKRDRDEERFYEMAAREIRAKKVVPGLMARAFSETDGDEKKAIARYVKYRVEQLRQEFETEVARRRTEDQERIRAEEERHRQQLERHCPRCGGKYRPTDYRPDAPAWYCSFCKNRLPKE